MKEVPHIVLNFALRVLVGGSVCWYLFTRINDSFLIILSPFLILLFVLIIAKPVVALVGLPAGSLFYPNDHFDRPQPIYGIPDARRKEHRFEEALEGYRKITGNHPQELKAWIRMIEVAACDLKDGPRASAIHEAGLITLQSPKDRDHLTSIYKLYSGMAQPRPGLPGHNPTLAP